MGFLGGAACGGESWDSARRPRPGVESTLRPSHARPPTAAQPRGRILGGREAEAHARPYMASVQLNGEHLCGGVLVAEQWVLSAAHCLEDA